MIPKQEQTKKKTTLFNHPVLMCSYNVDLTYYYGLQILGIYSDGLALWCIQ